MALLAFAVAAAGGEPGGGGRPDVVLVTIDTLRPDALGWIGGRTRTPALDALAQGGAAFPAAISSIPLTGPSHATILTGLFPPGHGVRDNGQALPESIPTLAERLSDAGWASAAFVSAFPLESSFGLDRGFGTYDDQLPDETGEDRERSCGHTTAAALAWAVRQPGPIFLWVHFYEPHAPWPALAEPRGDGSPWSAYYAEAERVDQCVEKLVKGLDVRPGPPRLTVYASDHGESLGEHGEAAHGFFVYDSTILVPLVFSQPGRILPRRIDRPGRLVDVAPTILDLVAAPQLAAPDGRSLRPWLEGREVPDEPAWIESHLPWIAYGWAPLEGARDSATKLIVAPRPELYDLRTDPGESTSLWDDGADQAQSLTAFVHRHKSRAVPSTIFPDDGETASRLDALGYLGSGPAPAAPADATRLSDPKDRLTQRALLLEADTALRDGAYAAAVTKFDAVLAADPVNRFAVFRSGVALLRGGRTAEAITRLERAKKDTPERSDVRYYLASANFQAGRYSEAAREWAELAAVQPKRGEAWLNLGVSQAALGRVDDARAALARGRELVPEDPRGWSFSGVLELGLGHFATAAEYLIRAEAVAGESFDHLLELATALHRSGRPAEALLRLEKIAPGRPGHAEACLQLALAAARQGHDERARVLLLEALAADPGLRPRALAHPDLAHLVDASPRALAGE